MARPLSMDLRQRIAWALRAGETTRGVAKRFGVSVATAVRVGQRWRAGHGLEPGQMGGHRGYILDDEAAAFVRARMAEKSDLTVRALAAELAERGTVVCPDTVWRFLRRSGLSVKKNAGGGRAGWTADGQAAEALADTPAPP
jgi:transposase